MYSGRAAEAQPLYRHFVEFRAVLEPRSVTSLVRTCSPRGGVHLIDMIPHQLLPETAMNQAGGQFANPFQ